jgi:hypothetical protein
MSDVVLISDFLDEADAMETSIGPAAKRGIRGHVIEICDPAEEVFPYAGRTEFRDPETGQKLVAGRAETVADDYRRAWLARRETMAQSVRRLGWSYLPHRTDRLASEALAAAHGLLSGIPAAKKATSPHDRRSAHRLRRPGDPVRTAGLAGDLVAVAADPAKARCGALRAAGDPGPCAQARGNPVAQPLVADLAQIVDRGPGDPGACRTGAQSPREGPEHDGPLALIIDNSWASASDWEPGSKPPRR